MKRFHRRCRRLCILAALLVLLVLFLRQNVLLDTASRHAILLDAQSGRVLAQKRADERTAPASLTKMMTVLLAIETEPDLDKQVTLPEDIFPALQTEKASMAGFVPDETVTVRDLLYGAMLPSGAECCEALAQLVSGSEENFAALMNQKAAELGMKNTHFTNATGLTDTEHYSSAADMAKLLQAALHNTTFPHNFYNRALHHYGDCTAPGRRFADQHTAGQAGRNRASDGNADRRRQNRVYRRRRAVSGQPCHRERKRVHPCYACRARRPRDGAVQYPRCSACVPETSG